MKHTTDYFIKKVEDTPEDMFCTDAYTNGSKSCILAMCGQVSFISTEESIALMRLFRKIYAYPTAVNDGRDSKYKQPTPKQRLLASLYDIKIIEQQEANVNAVSVVQCIQSLGVD